MPARFVVTGLDGFVGRALRAHLPAPVQAVRLSPGDWRERLAAAGFAGATVIHLAARAHAAGASEAELERDNVEKTAHLARAAAAAGATRLVFLSTVKVNGEETGGRPFGRADTPDPRDAYARSKWAAERTLAAIAKETGMAIVVVRAPLVYGPGPKGNLAALVRLADSPWPLPFASLANRRSFVHVDDLARLIVTCGTHPRAAGMTYFAAHEESISTARLVAALRHALGRPPRLFACPPAALEAVAALAGRGDVARRLTRSLEVDASDARRELEWNARRGLESAVADLAGRTP